MIVESFASQLEDGCGFETPLLPTRDENETRMRAERGRSDSSQGPPAAGLIGGRQKRRPA